MKRIKILGITGGVGAGKSTVLAYLKNVYGARILELDAVGHLLMRKGEACFARILASFGEEILGSDGEIDHAALAKLVFADRQSLERLNAIVHPMVKEYVRAQIAQEQARGEAPLIVLEAALLLEDHYDEICDGIWYICVNEEVRAQRLISSRGYSREKIAQVLKNQKTDEEFRASCQFVVDNSDDIIENTYEQIDRGLKKYGFL